MPTVNRHHHPKPSIFTLTPNNRFHRRGAPNRRVAWNAKLLIPDGKEYYLHSTKGWRARSMRLETDLDLDLIDEDEIEAQSD